MPVILTIILLVIIFAIFVMITYNSLVSARNNVHNAWSQIDVELQRRFDLIPNLVETVKGYMNHEESVLTKVTELRSSWGNASSISEKAKLENELTSTLSAISIVAENYPDLKANANFMSLQEELSNTESKIAYSRESYNNVTTAYNTKLEIFPNNIIAGMFNFKSEELFKVDNEEAKQNVKVSF
mgnify:CR=1